MGVHDALEPVFTMGRRTQTGPPFVTGGFGTTWSAPLLVCSPLCARRPF
jgi:hypothetical protein